MDTDISAPTAADLPPAGRAAPDSRAATSTDSRRTPDGADDRGPLAHASLATDGDRHAQAVLRRHGITSVNSRRVELSAIRALASEQAAADRSAGLGWTRLTVTPDWRCEPALQNRSRVEAPGGRPIGVDLPEGG
jgi:hypothetical protein